MEDLQKAIRCAQIMGCDKVRVFAGTRVADPATVYQMIADTLGEMSKLAEREKSLPAAGERRFAEHRHRRVNSPTS